MLLWRKWFLKSIGWQNIMSIYSCSHSQAHPWDLKEKKQLPLMEPHHWPLNSLDLNPVDFGIWGLLEQNVYQGWRIIDLYSLKEAIVEEWNKILQKIIDKYIDAFKPTLRRVTEVNGQQTERYWLLIIHIDISQYAFDKFGTILVN